MKKPILTSLCAFAALATLIAAMPASAKQVSLEVALSQPYLPANQKQTAFVKVGLTGFRMAADTRRAPVNVAIVLDKSGSMGGEKIQQARAAAITAVNRLAANDIVSIITYDDSVSVVVPATKLTDKATVIQAINRISAGGSTALFAGVSKGAAEVRKFLDETRVNRVILLSDGLANVGPSSPGDLAALGSSLGRESITVSTIGLGLGYNEDLMTQLASTADGNHDFVENASDLTRIFDREFGDVLSVVAQEVLVKVKCADGIRPVRVLGREAEIDGQTVTTSMNQIYSEQEKYVLLELELPATAADKSRDVVSVDVSYANMSTRTTDKLSSAVAVRFTNSKEVVQNHTNKEVCVASVVNIANDNNRQALALRDQGKVEEAKELLWTNQLYIDGHVKGGLDSKLLRDQRDFNKENYDNLDKANWATTRKQMRYNQYAVDKQQTRGYGGGVRTPAPEPKKK
jgi:Ca-activated chloride channel family protein